MLRRNQRPSSCSILFACSRNASDQSPHSANARRLQPARRFRNSPAWTLTRVNHSSGCHATMTIRTRACALREGSDMDPITVLVGVLSVAGSLARPISDQAVKDGYAGLKQLILTRFGDKDPSLAHKIAD